MSEETGRPWTPREVEVVVRGYLAMLDLQRRGETFVKRRHIEAMMNQLPVRSRASIEFKLCNVSAAMLERGLPTVAGYTAREHKQSLIGEVLDRVLEDSH